MIPAECHSDDFVFDAKFDAEPWFAHASDGEITDLAACGWGGDYPADAVAQHFDKEGCRDVENVMEYARRKKDMGFECSVDGGAAMRWVRDNRPALFPELCGITMTEPSEHDEPAVPAGP